MAGKEEEEEEKRKETPNLKYLKDDYTKALRKIPKNNWYCQD